MKRILMLVALIIILQACNFKSSIKENDTMKYVNDAHSFAQPNDAVVKHLSLDITVDFASKTIAGYATWEIEPTDANEIIFDTHHLVIQGVTLNDGETTNYEVGPYDPIKGSPLNIAISAQTKKVRIQYATTADSYALQWLSPEQTAGKKEPFLFTQSQAILARTWIPCQDSPNIRFTYDAKVKVDPRFLALMSAENPQQKNEEGLYEFKNPHAIPSYLMALCVGDLSFKNIGENTGVYAEPVTMPSAFYELGEMQEMVNAAEKLYGKYEWGRYDVVFLPPSFPFGGMENPMLTFCTPTILAGDRSLTSLIAHELAHSWSGNLVTNATWNDFWLNEGFTMYFERRIMESIYGKDYADMLAVIGYSDLKFSLEQYAEEGNTVDTKLKYELDGRDPDDGMSDIAYEKGYFFLKTIENVVGRKRFDVFVNSYFNHFKFQSVTTEQFLDYLYANLLEKDGLEEKQIQVQEWIYEPGLPSSFVVPVSARFQKVDEVVKMLAENPSANVDTASWSSHEWQRLLRELANQLDADKMKTLDARFHFTQTQNKEVAALWLQSAIRYNYEPAYAALENFLKEVGRRKFQVPLFSELMENPKTKEMGKTIYKKYRENYHAVSVKTLDEIVQ